MVGTIGAATSGFGGVAGYCCGGGGGGEEREEEHLPGLSGAKEEERERDETGSLSARERQQEQERPGPGRSAGGQGNDEERERRRVEREKKAEAEARRARRVQWTETRNLATNDPMRGARIMEATARDASELKRLSGVKATGRKLTKPLCHYSLSWAKDERPDRQEMSRAVTGSLQALGLENRQALIVAHGDTKCPHVHVIVNRVNPEHGKAAKLSGSRLKLSKWAERYERRQGRIRCQHRVWNNRKRARGERVRREPRLPRSRWQRERRHSVQVPRAKTPAGLSLAERSEWKNQERGARGLLDRTPTQDEPARAEHPGRGGMAGTLRPAPAGEGGREASRHHRLAADSALAGERFPPGPVAGHLDPQLGTLAQLAFRAGDAAEAGSGRAREGPLGAGGPHRPRGRRELSGCHERSRRFRAERGLAQGGAGVGDRAVGRAPERTGAAAPAARSGPGSGLWAGSLKIRSRQRACVGLEGHDRGQGIGPWASSSLRQRLAPDRGSLNSEHPDLWARR